MFSETVVRSNAVPGVRIPLSAKQSASREKFGPNFSPNLAKMAITSTILKSELESLLLPSIMNSIPIPTPGSLAVSQQRSNPDTRVNSPDNSDSSPAVWLSEC